MEYLDRQNQLIGEQATGKLRASRVAVVGLGGVGGAAFEALARCGVGALFAMDCDVFEATNRNRQILALVETEGQVKCDVAAKRALQINPGVEVKAVHRRFSAEDDGGLLAFRPDWVIDAIDSVSAKLALIALCKRHEIPVISSMGTGNRLTAEFRVGDIEQTAGCGCPLARIMRHELRKRDIQNLPVVYSTAAAVETGNRTPGSVAFVPPVAGYALAGHVVRSIIEFVT